MPVIKTLTTIHLLINSMTAQTYIVCDATYNYLLRRPLYIFIDKRLTKENKLS